MESTRLHRGIKHVNIIHATSKVTRATTTTTVRVPKNACLLDYRVLGPVQKCVVRIQKSGMSCVFTVQARTTCRIKTCRDQENVSPAYQCVVAAGKVFGLHSGDGHVMWSQSYGQHQAPQHIFPWRSRHDVQHAPELLAIHSSRNSNFYSILNAHTGAEVASGKLQHPVSQVLPAFPKLLAGLSSCRHVKLQAWQSCLVLVCVQVVLYRQHSLVATHLQPLSWTF